MVEEMRMFIEEDYFRLLNFYEKIDGHFLPRLSEREGGLEGHMCQILDNQGGFFYMLLMVKFKVFQVIFQLIKIRKRFN